MLNQDRVTVQISFDVDRLEKFRSEKLAVCLERLEDPYFTDDKKVDYQKSFDNYQAADYQELAYNLAIEATIFFVSTTPF